MITVYIDGGARGNPGPAGFGVRVEDAAGTMIDSCTGALASQPTTSPNTTDCSRP